MQSNGTLKLNSQTHHQHHHSSLTSTMSHKQAGQPNNILFVKNLPYESTSDELYELFGRFGAVRQIRAGSEKDTKGTAFVVYEDIDDATEAVKTLSGFNYKSRYLVALFHSLEQMDKTAENLEARRAKLEELKKEHGLE